MRLALDGRPGEWDTNMETAHVMRVGDEWWMFYAGCVTVPGRFVCPYEIGLAKSPDGVNWTRASDEPVLPLADAGPDSGAMTSPAVVEFEGEFYMIYLGWELDADGGFVDFRISGAVSEDPEGLVWTRHDEAVLRPPIEGASWIDGAVEPTLMRASDGLFYLYITADRSDDPDSPSNIAVLRSAHPFGPWEACPEPVVRMTEPWESEEVIAPHVMEDEGKLRMWYHGLTLDDPVQGEKFSVGYADVPFVPACGADLNGDGLADLADITGFVLAFLAGGPGADLNPDGVIDLIDVLRFLVVFESPSCSGR
jgi:beta-xylosidase